MTVLPLWSSKVDIYLELYNVAGALVLEIVAYYYCLYGGGGSGN